MKSRINIRSLVSIAFLSCYPLALWASWASISELYVQGSTNGYVETWETDNGGVTHADGEIRSMWTGLGKWGKTITGGSLAMNDSDCSLHCDYLSIGYALNAGGGT